MGALFGIGLKLLGGLNIGSMLGLLKNPFVLGLAFLAWTAYQRHDAGKNARAECQAEQLKADMAELRRQIAARDRLLADMRIRADATEAEMEALEKERDDILAELAAAPADAAAPVCSYPPGIAERLRTIQ